MNELRERMRDLDGIEPPDLWPRIREGRPRGAVPDVRARWMAAAAAVLIAAGGGLVAIRAFRTVAPLPGPAGPPVESSAVTGDGTLRCTARLPSSIVQPGRPTGITFEVENLTDREQTYQNGWTYPVLQRPNGTEIWNGDPTLGGRGGRRPPDEVLPPRATRRLRSSDVVVRWPGALSIVPICGVTHAGSHVESMPLLRVTTVIAGSTPDEADAVALAVEASGTTFAGCAPLTSRDPVIGEVRGRPARCEALVEVHPGFASVALTYVSPADAPPVTFPRYLHLVELPGDGAIAVGRQWFVVVHERAHAFGGMQTVSRLRDGSILISG